MSYTCPILITDVFIFFVFLMYKAKHQISLNYKASLFTINIDLMFTLILACVNWILLGLLIQATFCGTSK